MADFTAGPPRSLENEQTVLASLFFGEAAILAATERLTSESFYSPAHRAIFAAALDLRRRNIAVDLPSLRDRLTATGQLDDVGGYAYLVDLASAAPFGSDYAIGQVAMLAKRRAFIDELRHAMEAAYDLDNADPIGEHQARVLELDLAEKSADEWIGHGELLRENAERIEAASGDRIDGAILTGFEALDERVPMTGGDMVVLAARTGYGKTSLAYGIARNVATSGLMVGFFSLEMSRAALARRAVSHKTGVSVKAQMRGKLEGEDWRAIAAQIGEDADLPLFYADRALVTVDDIAAQCQRLEVRQRRKMGLVVVDYLGLVESAGRESETVRVSKISRQLKVLAGRLGCPVLALAQLNRQVDNRDGGRPKLSDLKQSGSIEQDASVVLFIHREGHKDGEPLGTGPVEIIIAKNRHAAQGSISLHFDASRTRFSDAGGFDAEAPDESWAGDHYERVL